MKHLVVLTGAGMSAESGIKTFRDAGGLWEEHDVMEVASYDGWLRNKELVLRFYNERRRQLATCQPNKGHFGIKNLENYFEVDIVTQNVDNLHERAGSSRILHLHGELTKIRSTTDEKYVKDIGYNDISLGDLCPKGGQLRPHIVWFGEAVPLIDTAARICEEAHIFVVIGSSLNVYPAAGLINFVPPGVPVFVIDPNPVMIPSKRNIEFIKKGAEEGVEILTEKLLKL